MEKKKNTKKVEEVSVLNKMEEMLYVVKIGKAYVSDYFNREKISLTKAFKFAYLFNTYHSANKIATIIGGEVLRVGAYSLMFLNSDGDIYRENNGKKGLNK